MTQVQEVSCSYETLLQQTCSKQVPDGAFLHVAAEDLQSIVDAHQCQTRRTAWRIDEGKDPGFVCEKVTSYDNTFIILNETPSKRARQSRLNDRPMRTIDSPALFYETGEARIQMPDQRVDGLAS